MKTILFDGSFRLSGDIKVPENLTEIEDIIEYICYNIKIEQLKLSDIEFDDIYRMYNENKEVIYEQE